MAAGHFLWESTSLNKHLLSKPDVTSFFLI